MTTPDRIERDVLIDAPVEVVWQIVTEPDQIAQWLSDGAEVDVRAGGAGVLRWNHTAGKSSQTVALQIERIEPPWLFTFRWLFPEGVEPTVTNSALVELSLAAEGDRTRLRVAESGLLEVERTPEERESYFESHSSGWEGCLDRVRDLLSTDAAIPRS